MADNCEQYGFFALLYRMKYIDRWGLMRSICRENIAEHSLMTALFAHALALIGRERFGGTIDPERAAAIAMLHDATEIFTGDLPTPVKYADPAISAAYKRVEGVACERLIACLPDELREEYRSLLSFEEEPALYRLIKAADTLSAYVKCIEELKGGNAEFESARAQLERKLDSFALPELDYFREKLLPSFSLTLDELNRP